MPQTPQIPPYSLSYLLDSMICGRVEEKKNPRQMGRLDTHLSIPLSTCCHYKGLGGGGVEPHVIK